MVSKTALRAEQWIVAKAKRSIGTQGVPDMDRRLFFAFTVGAGTASAAPYLVDATRRAAAPLPLPPEGAKLQLAPFPVDPSWVKQGTPNFRALEYARSPDGHTITGLWACDGPCTFEWTFAHDETVHLLEGEVQVNYLGRNIKLVPGSTASFQAETRATWHVSQYARKTFTLQEPGRMVRWARRAGRLLGQA